MTPTTLSAAVKDALNRLGDSVGTVWSTEEMKLYLQDGYDTFCRRSKVLFDKVVVENLPPTGNWTDDLSLYHAQQKPGLGYTDGPLHFTRFPDSVEQQHGSEGKVGGSYGPQAAGITNPGQRYLAAGHDVETSVNGGYLPQSTVDVLRVTYDDRDLLGMGSQQMRRLDATYETRDGDPQFFTYDKDGLFFLRVIPAASGNAPYPEIVNGGFGVLTQEDEQLSTLGDGLLAYWPCDENTGATVVNDAYGSNDLATIISPFLSATGIHGGASTGVSTRAVQRATTSFRPTTDMTISLWTKRNSSASADLRLLDTVVGPQHDWMIVLDNSTGNLTAYLFNSVGGNVTATVPVPSAGVWHQILVEINTTNKTISVAVDNGTPVVSTVLSGTIAVASTQFAAWSNGSLEVLHDEMAIWSRLLTAAEKAEWYNAGSGKFFPFGNIATTIVTTETNGFNSGGFGLLRAQTDAFPAGGPWGSPTRIHPSDSNIVVDVARLGRPLFKHPFELPDAYVKYVIFYAMARALRRDGNGQDIELADHYDERFEMGVYRVTHKRDRMQTEKVTQFGMPPQEEPFGLGAPKLSSFYPDYPW